MNALDVRQLYERELAGMNVTVQAKQQDEHLHILVAGQDALEYYLKSFTQQVVSAIADDGSPWETLTVWTRGRDATKSTVATHVNFPEIGIEIVLPEPEVPQTPVNDDPPEAEPTELDLSQFCFTRNTMLLDNALATPPAAVATAVRSLHELDLPAKAVLLPAIATFLEGPKRFDTESFSPTVQLWFEAASALDDRQLKTLGIWLSRYCRRPEETMTELEPVL